MRSANASMVLFHLKSAIEVNGDAIDPFQHPPIIFLFPKRVFFVCLSLNRFCHSFAFTSIHNVLLILVYKGKSHISRLLSCLNAPTNHIAAGRGLPRTRLGLILSFFAEDREHSTTAMTVVCLHALLRLCSDICCLKGENIATWMLIVC